MTGTSPEPTTAPTDQNPTAPPQNEPPKVPTFTGEFDPDRAAKALAAARADAEAEKGKRQTAQQEFEAKLKAITDALGLTDGKVDPEKLAGDLKSAQDAARQGKTELAVMRAALKAGADPDALLDSKAFLSGLESLNPSDQTFTANVEAAVKAALENSPRLKAAEGAPGTTRAPEAGRSGADFAGGTGQPRQVTEAELTKMTPDQIVEAQEKGLLNDLLGVS